MQMRQLPTCNKTSKCRLPPQARPEVRVLHSKAVRGSRVAARALDSNTRAIPASPELQVGFETLMHVKLMLTVLTLMP
jgi:hypothetical protein